MADKELIKKEIERRIEKYGPDFKTPYDAMYQLLTLLDLINSLPEEPESEDLEEEIENYIKDSLAIKFPTTDKDQIKADIRYIARHFAEWQKEKDYKMYAHMSLKDIHDAWQELKKNKPDIEKYPAICFQKGADWRENQMKEALQTEYEKGRFDVREEMMKDTINGIMDCDDDNEWIEITDKLIVTPSIAGNKVKIIIVKTEQQ